MLPDPEFATNHAGQSDVAMFDFTSMHRAENASLVKERKGKRLLIGLVGDCLVEVCLSGFRTVRSKITFYFGDTDRIGCLMGIKKTNLFILQNNLAKCVCSL